MDKKSQQKLLDNFLTFFPKGKKGSGNVVGEMMALVLGLAVILVIIVIFFPNLFGFGDFIQEEKKTIQNDIDKDGIRNFADACPCLYGEGFDGCPEGLTPPEKEDEAKRYNTDTGCGDMEVGADGKAKFVAGKGSFAFKHYRSVELFADDDGDADVGSEVIRQACVNWIGVECPSEDNDCDTDEYSYEDISNGCWVMISEDDGGITDQGFNDCGQAKVDNGRMISLNSESGLGVDPTNDYFSIDEEEDPINLLRWKWRSTPDYGSLICKNGFWFGCKEGGEEKILPIGDKKYQCKNNEWGEFVEVKKEVPIVSEISGSEAE